MVFGLALPGLALGAGARAVFVNTLIVTAYAFSLALLLGPIVGERGLEPTGPAQNGVVFLANAVGGAGTFVVVLLLIAGAWRATQRAA